MKMIKAADVSPGSRIRAICLPPYEPPVLRDHNTERSTSFYRKPESEIRRKPRPPRPNPNTATKYLEKLNNLTKTVFSGVGNKKHNKNTKYNVRVSNDNKHTERKNDEESGREDSKKKDIEDVYDSASIDSVVKLIKTKVTKQPKLENNINVKRSDKKLMFGEEIDPFIDDNNGIDFKDECYATGWGREQTNGTLTDVLLEAEVPVLPLQLCRDRYSLTLPLNDGHLCAGSTDGSTGACVVSDLLRQTIRSVVLLLFGCKLKLRVGVIQACKQPIYKFKTNEEKRQN